MRRGHSDSGFQTLQTLRASKDPAFGRLQQTQLQGRDKPGQLGQVAPGPLIADTEQKRSQIP